MWAVRVLQRFARVSTSLFGLCVFESVFHLHVCLCVCVCPSSRRHFLKRALSDIGWLLYNLTGLCAEAGCAMSH